MLSFVSGFTVGSCLLFIWYMVRTERWENRSVLQWNINDIPPELDSTTFPSNQTNLIARIVMGKERGS